MGAPPTASKGSLRCLGTGWSVSKPTSPVSPGDGLSTRPHLRAPARSPLDPLPLGSRCWGAASAQGPRLPCRQQWQPRDGVEGGPICPSLGSAALGRVPVWKAHKEKWSLELFSLKKIKEENLL